MNFTQKLCIFCMVFFISLIEVEAQPGGDFSLRQACNSAFLDIYPPIESFDDNLDIILITAIEIGDVDCAKALIETAKVDVNQQVGRQTVLFVASKYAPVCMISQYTLPSGETASYCQYVGLEIVITLIKNGADVNFRDSRGYTTLMSISEHVNDLTRATGRDGYDVSFLDVVQALISAGADVNAQGNDGETALSLARGRWDWLFGESELARALRDAGATL